MTTVCGSLHFRGQYEYCCTAVLPGTEYGVVILYSGQEFGDLLE